MYVAVATYLNPLEAHVSRGLIASEGIPVHLEGEHHIWSNWQMSQVLGGVRVVVPTQFSAQAAEVLTRRDLGEFEEALVEKGLSSKYKCAKCGSEQLVEVRPYSAIFTGLLASFLLGAIFPILKYRKCGACGEHENFDEQPLQ